MREEKRLMEAILFASAEPVSETELGRRVAGTDVAGLLNELAADYRDRGVRLERHGDAWAFRTAADLSPRLAIHRRERQRLSRAAMETLAVIAYQQPVTRAEIEALRGVSVARGTLDLLVEAGWVAPRGRRDAPGRPVTWVTTRTFLDQFDLASLGDLPRLDELEGGSLFDAPVDG